MQSADYSISEATNLFENINREILLGGSRFEAAVARRFPSASSGGKGGILGVFPGSVRPV